MFTRDPKRPKDQGTGQAHAHAVNLKGILNLLSCLLPPRDWHPSTQRRACARAQNTWLNKHVWVYIRLYICIVSSMFIKTPKQQQQEDVPPLLESGKQGEIWHRDLHGPFQTLRDLWDAPGNTLAELKERCRISYVNDYVNQVTE